MIFFNSDYALNLIVIMMFIFLVFKLTSGIKK